MFLYQFEEKWEELGWSVSYDDRAVLLVKISISPFQN